jgi:RluA family pseudouridine synthase
MRKIRPEILFDDEYLLAVDKPAGIAVIPERFAPPGESLIERLRERDPDLLVVHRLDRDTSGAVLFARTPEVHQRLNTAFETGQVDKLYLALVEGAPLWEEETIDLPIRTNADRRHRSVIDPGRGKPSSTAYRVVERLGPFTLVEARPATGRTHQIRVHLAAAGSSCACDPLYGSGEPILLSRIKRGYKQGAREERPLLARLGLHAHRLRFNHPALGHPVEIESPLPRDLSAAVNQLRKNT